MPAEEEVEPLHPPAVADLLGVQWLTDQHHNNRTENQTDIVFTQAATCCSVGAREGHLLEQVQQLGRLLVRPEGYQRQHPQDQAANHHLLLIVQHVDATDMLQPPEDIQHMPDSSLADTAAGLPLLAVLLDESPVCLQPLRLL